ncbi:MAG: hypothetical protein C0469_06340 [Cyanobacteria bacterium DS2.3.42]|nr:hypothetical protein [Cyanobacteria bacterium DS2.3.42]
MSKSFDEEIKQKSPDLVVDQDKQQGSFVESETQTFGDPKSIALDESQTFDAEATAVLPDGTAGDDVAGLDALRATINEKAAEMAKAAIMAQAAAAVKNPLIGHVFDEKYELTRVLGSGGMSVVYEAKHLVMNRVVAVKVMHSHLLQSEKAVLRFQKEAQAVAALNHNGIMRIYDIGLSPDGAPYIAMEFLEGKSLSDFIKEDGRLEESKALPMFKTIAESLAHAHTNRVIHRDLKPSNIVLATSPNSAQAPKPTIVDFGIAKVTVEEGDDQFQVTRTGEIFGSPLYMSPEQCAGRVLDHRSDIYSFGCLMYEAITGKPPFEATSAMSLFHSHQKVDAPRFDTLGARPEVSEELESIILKCLEKHPQDRFQSMDELVKAFDLLGDKGSVPLLVRARRKQNVITLCVALLMVAIGVIFADQWKLVQGQAVFFMLCLLVTASGSYSMFQRFFRTRDRMKLRSTSLNWVQKVRLSFTFAMAVIMSVWSLGMMVYIASKATQSPLIDALAQWLWFGSLLLVGCYLVGALAFAAVAAIRALSDESA